MNPNLPLALRACVPLVMLIAACQAPPFAGTSPSSAVVGTALPPLALTASSRTISGTATLGTAAFSAASIQVRRIDDDTLLGTATTGTDGSFTLELNPEPPAGTPLRVAATKDGRTLAALAFAGRREGARYRLSQAAAPAAFVALNPASTLALAAFLKRIKAVALELKLPQNQAIVLNALPFLLEAYEKAKLAAAETLENILASATAAGPGGGSAGGGRPDLGNLSAVEQQVLERVLEGLLTAVKPLGDIELPQDIVAAITATDSPLREVAENVLTLLNEAVEVATEETLRSPPPSLSPEVWASELPIEAAATPAPDETASGGVNPPASPDDLATPTTSLPSPTPTPRSGGGGGSSVAATPPPARFAFDAFEPFEALGFSATAQSLPSDAKPAAMAVSGSSWYYLDANFSGTPAFEPSPAIRSDYRYEPPVRGLLRDSAHATLSATPACFVVPGATTGQLFFADENHVYKYAAASATLWLGGLDKVTALASDGTHVYVAEGGSGALGGRVSRVSQSDLTATASVLSGLSWPTDLAVVGSELFVLDRGRDHDGTLQSVKTTNLAVVTLLASGQNQPLALAGDSSTMYFTALQEGRRVLRAVRPGGVGNVFNVLPGGVYVHPYLQADANNLYVLTSHMETASLWLGASPPPLPNHVNLMLLPFSGGPAKLMSTFAGRSDPLGFVVKDGKAHASFGGSNRGVMNVSFVDG